MHILGTIQQKQHCFLHGGCEVLRLAWDEPTGNTPAAAHFTALIKRLSAYAEQILLPDAAETLTHMATEGQAYRFIRRCYRLALRVTTAQRYTAITLTVTLAAGEELLFFRELHTVWDSTGSYQLDSPKKFKNTKALKKEKRRIKRCERGKKQTDPVA